MVFIYVNFGGVSKILANRTLYSTVVKADLVDRVYTKIGFTRQEALEAVEIIFNEIKLVLAKGEDVRITGFAGFLLKDKNARNARNPRTGGLIRIRARRVLTFKPSQQLLISTNHPKYESQDT